MERPETKVLGTEVVEICGLKIEVRLIESQVYNYNTKVYQPRILPRARYLGNSNLTKQQMIKKIVRDALHESKDDNNVEGVE